MILLLLACGNNGVAVLDTPEEIPAELRDDDEDGFVAEEDCDDNDPDSNPDGEEGTAPDGADNDCDGYEDEFEVGCDGVTEDIMEAVGIVEDGMTILVCPGTYREDLVLDGRELTIQSMEGPKDTTIEGSGDTSVVSMENAEIGLIGFTVREGVATNGGGIYAKSSNLTVDDCIVEDNSATEYGGGIYVIDTPADILNSTVEGNSAYEGGGIWAQGQVTIQGNEIVENHCTSLNESEAYHGADGGGGGLFYRGRVDVLDNVIARNVSEVNGGGVYSLDASGDFIGNTVEDNETWEDGAGHYANYSSETFEDNVFEDNFAHDDAGGLRIYVGSVEIRRNHFEGNGCNDDGGGLKLSHANNTIDDNTFIENYAGDSGGGVELDNDVSTLENATFKGNRAYRGAAVNSKENFSANRLRDLVFEDNEASGAGGAIYLYDNAYTTTIERIWVDGGDAPFGAAIAGSNANLVLRNAMIRDQDGDAIELTESTGNIGNVIIDYCSGTGVVSDGAYTLWNGIFTRLEIGVEGPASVSYTSFYDNDYDGDSASGTGVIDDDCELTSDYELGSGSPCIDAGSPDVDDKDGTRSDLGYHGGPNAP